MSAPKTAADRPPLSAEQWAGLAWLGDLCSGFASHTSAQERDALAKALPKLLRTLQEALDFFQQHWAGDATRLLVAASDHLQRHALDQSIPDLLETLDTLHRNRFFELLRELSDYAAGIDENLHLPAVFGDLLSKAGRTEALGALGRRITHLDDLMEAAERALLEEAQASSAPYGGGLRGVYHLLTDPQMQRGLHVMVTLFPLIMKHLRQEQASSGMRQTPPTGRSAH